MYVGSVGYTHKLTGTLDCMQMRTRCWYYEHAV